MKGDARPTPKKMSERVWIERHKNSAIKRREKENAMKNKIIAFLTDPENFDTQSVTDAMRFFPETLKAWNEDPQASYGILAQKLENYFHTREEVEVSEWIAEEDREAFEAFCESYY